MVELRRLAPHDGVRLFAKLEGANPTGSVKDRVARAMVESARGRSGSLRPGQTILEPSSGNTGISLAMIGARLGHPVRIVMPDNTTARARAAAAPVRRGDRLLAGRRGLERRDPAGPATGRCRPERCSCRTSTATRRIRGAHEATTGPEILAQVPEVDVFVAGLGTGGTLTGVGRFLKRARPGVRIVAAEPLPGELVQGLRSLDDGFVPPVLDASVLDDRFLVDNRDAVIGVRRLLRRRGHLRRPVVGRGAGGGGPRGARHGGRQRRGPAGRRRLEVPVDRPVDAATSTSWRTSWRASLLW